MKLPRLHLDLSIRVKLILIIAGTLVIAQAASAFLIRQVVSRNIVQQALTTVDILTTSIVHDLTYEAQRNPESDGQQIIAKYMTYYRDVTDMQIYDAQALCLASSDTSNIRRRADSEVTAAVVRAKPALHVTRHTMRDLGIRSVAPLTRGSRVVGAVAIEVSRRDIEATLGEIDQQITTIMAIKLLLVCSVLFVLLRTSLMVRLQHLMSLTHQIIAGNYTVRVLDPKRDEIGQLARAFDQMTSDLQKSKLQIENDQKLLEQRIEEATSQLQKAYEDLKGAQGQLVMNEKMATLGVLIAGIAHEINTPAGAILNVSRSLEKQVQTLPERLAAFKNDADIPVADMVACLQALIAASSSTRSPATHAVGRAVEGVLRDHGVDDYKTRAASLCKLNFTDTAEITRYIECVRLPSFFTFAESFASIAQAATISQKSAHKIAEIIRALKYYAYADTDRVGPIQVNESIATVLVLLDSHLKHSVAVHTDYDLNLPVIPGTSELHQVWTNLITNAVDAIAQRGAGEPGEIRIATRLVHDSVVVSLTDNGSGIPESVQDRIFDPFFTTKDIGKGTGLGLSIVSGIVNRHHGSARVESIPGRTMFEIRLPVNPHEKQPRPAAADGSDAVALDSKAQAAESVSDIDRTHPDREAA